MTDEKPSEKPSEWSLLRTKETPIWTLRYLYDREINP